MTARCTSEGREGPWPPQLRGVQGTTVLSRGKQWMGRAEEAAVQCHWAWCARAGVPKEQVETGAPARGCSGPPGRDELG